MFSAGGTLRACGKLQVVFKHTLLVLLHKALKNSRCGALLFSRCLYHVGVNLHAHSECSGSAGTGAEKRILFQYVYAQWKRGEKEKLKRKPKQCFGNGSRPV